MTGSTVEMLICILAMLTGILIGKKYREWKKGKSLPKAKKPEQTKSLRKN